MIPPASNALDWTLRRARQALHGSWLHHWPPAQAVYTRLIRLVQNDDAADTMAISFRGALFEAPRMDVTVTPTLRDGSYELEELDAWLGMIRQGETVVDVGANIGVYTVLSALAIGAHGRVIALEPEERNRQLLTGNCAVNGCGNVEIIGACAGAECGLIPLNIDDRQSGTHSVIRSGSETVTVPVVTLDQVCGVQRIDAIKIDVEGFEAAVLQGAMGVIKRDRPRLLVEFVGDDKVAFILADLLEGTYRQCRFISRRESRDLGPSALRSMAGVRTLGNLVLTA